MRSRFLCTRSAERLTTTCLILFPFVAPACPICDTETGEQVRAGIFGGDFWSTLLVVASPFPVLLVAIAAYHFDWLKLGSHAARTTDPPTAP